MFPVLHVYRVKPSSNKNFLIQEMKKISFFFFLSQFFSPPPKKRRTSFLERREETVKETVNFFLSIKYLFFENEKIYFSRPQKNKWSYIFIYDNFLLFYTESNHFPLHFLISVILKFCLIFEFNDPKNFYSDTLFNFLIRINFLYLKESTLNFRTRIGIRSNNLNWFLKWTIQKPLIPKQWSKVFRGSPIHRSLEKKGEVKFEPCQNLIEFSNLETQKSVFW